MKRTWVSGLADFAIVRDFLNAYQPSSSFQVAPGSTPGKEYKLTLSVYTLRMDDQLNRS